MIHIPQTLIKMLLFQFLIPFFGKVSNDELTEHRLIERQIFIDETNRRKKHVHRVTT